MPAARPARQLPPPTPLPSGMRLGPYELRNMLGFSAFGIVYRVTDHEGDQDLAVKEYLPNTLARREGPTDVVLRGPAHADAYQQGLRFFVNEARLLGQIDHPALIKVHASWQAHGTAYMAMSLSTGRNLRDTMQSRWKSLSEPALRKLLDDLLGALEQLHNGGLQHRDIAPQNIMIEPDGRPLLMDLGSPRRMNAVADRNGEAGPRSGFAPVELYGKGAGLERGPWTDFYSLAASVHYVICGKPPAAALTRSEDDRAGLRLERPDLRHSMAFLAVIDWMLALQPADRPRSVAEVRQALAGGPVPARHTPPRRKKLAARLRQHKRWFWVAAAVAVLAAVGAYVWRLWKSGLLRWPAGLPPFG